MTTVLICRNTLTDSCHNLTSLMPRCTKTSFLLTPHNICAHRDSDNLHNAVFIGYSLVARVMADEHLIVVIHHLLFYVFHGRPRRLIHGGAKVITLRAMYFSSRLCTCANHRRGPLRMTSSMGGRFSSRLMSSFRMYPSLYTPRNPRSILIYAVTIFLLLLVFIAQHSLPYARAGLMITSYT